MCYLITGNLHAAKRKTMKQSLIEIRPEVFKKNQWHVRSKDLPHKRVNIQTHPSPLGFFFFPTTMSKKLAFEKLRRCMVEAHRQEIEKLEKSMKSLEEIENPFFNKK